MQAEAGFGNQAEGAVGAGEQCGKVLSCDSGGELAAPDYRAVRADRGNAGEQVAGPAVAVTACSARRVGGDQAADGAGGCPERRKDCQVLAGGLEGLRKVDAPARPPARSPRSRRVCARRSGPGGGYRRSDRSCPAGHPSAADGLRRVARRSDRARPPPAAAPTPPASMQAPRHTWHGSLRPRQRHQPPPCRRRQRLTHTEPAFSFSGQSTSAGRSSLTTNALCPPSGYARRGACRRPPPGRQKLKWILDFSPFGD